MLCLKKAKSYFYNFFEGVVKNGCGCLSYRTLRWAVSEELFCMN